MNGLDSYKRISSEELGVGALMPPNTLDKQKKAFAERLFSELTQKTIKKLSDIEHLKLGHARHRFKGVRCVRSTALEKLGFGPRFLHANFVTLKTADLPSLPEQRTLSEKILTQYPLAQDEGENCKYAKDASLKLSTVEMFWRTVMDKSNLIIDLTGPEDKVQELYYPTRAFALDASRGTKTCGKTITVTCDSIEKVAHNITLNRYTLTSGELKKQITRIHYPEWTDHKGVQESDLAKILYLKALEDKEKSKYIQRLPTVVHCRAGVGRSGTYTVIDGMVELQRAGLLTAENFSDVAFHLTLSGRTQRGALFVQTAEQFRTLLDIGSYLTCKASALRELSPIIAATDPENPISVMATDVIIEETPDQWVENPVNTRYSGFPEEFLQHPAWHGPLSSKREEAMKIAKKRLEAFNVSAEIAQEKHILYLLRDSTMPSPEGEKYCTLSALERNPPRSQREFNVRLGFDCSKGSWRIADKLFEDDVRYSTLEEAIQAAIQGKVKAHHLAKIIPVNSSL